VSWIAALFVAACDLTVSFRQDGAVEADGPTDGSLSRDVTPLPDGCICSTEYKPVCGYEGVTYENMCVADCVGADVECERECPCEVGQPCAGFGGDPCPPEFTCLDALGDDCDPSQGGLDCPGLCAPLDCGDGVTQSIPCPEGYACVDVRGDGCDPGVGINCPGRCEPM